jgi:type IV pilus assembly protein PilW
MIAMALGMLIIIAISSLVLSGKTIQSTQMSASIVHDTAMNALNNIARSAKQAGFTDYSTAASILKSTANASPNIVGLDASTLKATTYGIENPIKSPSLTSDVLAVRFSGLHQHSSADFITNCAGFEVPVENSDDDRGWSIYYVANDSTGEPNLYCKYKNKTFTAQSIAAGVESFRVLYGLDTSNPPNKIANKFLSATEIDALDAGIPKGDLNKKTHWKKITAIKVALLIHGPIDSPANNQQMTFNLFGTAYPSSGNATAATITDADTPTKYKRRIRKIFSTTIQIKNSVS